jgi:molecular chaperone IbpA
MRYCAANIIIARKEDAMRTVDFSPLYRSTVGFDRMANLLQTMGQFDPSAPAYPPYNIEQSGENDYRVTMAVAGFSEADLSVEIKEDTLTVTGRRNETEQNAKFLHQGIAGRSFERRFQLAEHMQVTAAKLENGLLQIGIVRVIPEEKKTRRIEIVATAGPSEPRIIESGTARAA